MLTFLIRFLASKLAGIGGNGFDNVVEWVVEVSSENLKGWEKAEEVIRLFGGRWGEVANFAVRTVVQLAYAYAKIKGLLEEE